MIDFSSAEAPEVGHNLQGFGINLLVSDVKKTIRFLNTVFDFEITRASNDYAILKHRKIIYQLHGDHTYYDHPLLSILPESGLRGAGAEFRLYDVDPDVVQTRAIKHDYTVLQSCADKPHGLRECYILDTDGYCWVPSIKY